MKTRYLLPHSLKLPGWIILGIGIVLGILTLILMRYLHLILDIPGLFFNINYTDFSDLLLSSTDDNIIAELAGLFIIIGSLFVSLSKEKIEDERIMKIRLDSLVWAVIVNSILMILALFTIYGIVFYSVLMFSIVSIPLLFILKFRIALWTTLNTKSKYLLPNKLKISGWIILVLGIIIGLILLILGSRINFQVYMPALYCHGFGWEYDGWFKLVPDKTILDEIAGLFIIVGSIFVALSKEKIEDEFIMRIRLESLLWALIANSIFLIIAIFTFYGKEFFLVMNINIASIPLLFLIKYKIALRRGY